jgi:peptide/nickel transport system permease protein
MARYLGKRVLGGLLTIFLVLTFTFVLARLAGDPVALLVPITATDDEIAAYRTALGLDLPLPVQYWNFITSAVHLDFGNSLRSNRPAFEIIMERLPATLSLASAAFVSSLVVALGLGLVNELTRSRVVRSTILGFSLVRDAMPTFVFGLIMIYIFGVQLHVLPFIGNRTPASFVMPTITLATMTLALYLRLLRSGFAEELGKDYVRTAVSKGSSRFHLIVREVFPNVLPPFVTIVALNLGGLIVGSVLVEAVFSWPGIAYAIIEAVDQRDFPVIQAGVVVVATVFVAVNIIADVLNIRIDPRVRV